MRNKKQRNKQQELNKIIRKRKEKKTEITSIFY